MSSIASEEYSGGKKKSAKKVKKNQIFTPPYTTTGSSIDLASPRLLLDRPEKERGTKLKPGRKLLYVGGYKSVENTLRKQIKVNVAVYTRWLMLKGDMTHSKFASVMLDLFENQQKNADKSPEAEGYE